jgi:hypothetical protein
MLAIDFDIGNIVLEDGGDVHLQTRNQPKSCRSTLQGALSISQVFSRQAFDRSRQQKGGPYLRESPLGKHAVKSKRLAVCTLETVHSTLSAPRSWERNTHINRQVFPQAPSPTMTSLRRISAMMIET